MVRARLRIVAAACAVIIWTLMVPADAADMTRLAKTVFGEGVVLVPDEATPPAAAARADGALVGFVFSTGTVVGSVGYSGKPIDIAVAINVAGTILGASLLSHSEPILVIGVSDKDLTDFLTRLSGHDLRDRLAIRRGSRQGVDGIAGATISAQVMADAVLRSARAVAAGRGLLGNNAMMLDFSAYAPASWPDLLTEGSLARRTIRVGEATAALAERGHALFAPGTPIPPDDAVFVDLYAGLATPARVGRNLLGEVADNRVRADLGIDDQLLFIAAHGLYSVKGTAWRRSGHFERIAIEQGDRTITLSAATHHRVEKLLAGDTPELRESALFVIPSDSGFNPAMPWRLRL
ncbi:MAG: FMN-binding protein, partial [Alphaproteobacteria bacterium]|nr:FMN-binding protein [Alphaproteobacteria bacterium]